MRPVSPRLDGYNEIMVAEEQHEFMPLAVTVLPHTDGTCSVVARWTFSADERRRIADGEDVFLGMPAMQRITPHWLCVGPPSGTSIGSVEERK